MNTTLEPNIDDMREAVIDHYFWSPNELDGDFWGNGEEDPDQIQAWVAAKVDEMTDAEVRFVFREKL